MHDAVHICLTDKLVTAENLVVEIKRDGVSYSPPKCAAENIRNARAGYDENQVTDFGSLRPCSQEVLLCSE